MNTAENREQHLPPHDPEPGEIKKPGQEVTAPRSDVLGMLQSIDRGRLVLGMEDACRDVVQACMQHMKKGQVTIVLDFDPDKQTQAMRVSADIKKKVPRAPAHASFFFPTPDGGLSRVDNRQQQMFPGEE